MPWPALALTPPSIGLDEIVTIGIVGLFAGVLVDGLVGWLVCRRWGFEAGIGTGMVLFGSTGLATAAWLAVFLFLESGLHVLPRSGCETLAEGEPATSRNLYVLERAGQPPRRLVAPPRAEPCSEEPPPPLPLRVRHSDLAAAAGDVTAVPEDDPRNRYAIIGVFAAFGGFGVLGGIVLLSTGAADRRRARGVPEPSVRPVHPRAASLAGAFTIAGNLVFVAGIVGAGFVDDTVRSFSIAFNGPALACACYAIAHALQRKLTLGMAAMLLLLGGGFALAAAAVRYMA